MLQCDLLLRAHSQPRLKIISLDFFSEETANRNQNWVETLWNSRKVVEKLLYRYRNPVIDVTRTLHSIYFKTFYCNCPVCSSSPLSIKFYISFLLVLFYWLHGTVPVFRNRDSVVSDSYRLIAQALPQPTTTNMAVEPRASHFWRKWKKLNFVFQ